MSGLWIPPRHEAERQREEVRAGVLSMVQRFQGVMDYWTRRFREELNDDRLECIFAPPTSSPLSGLKPGRYHMIRDNQTTIPSIFPIETPGGDFCEPSAYHVELFREMDLQNPQVTRAHKEQLEREEKAAERAKERETEERHEELTDRVKAAMSTRVSMNRDTPWTQNVAGRRGRKK